MPTQLLFGVYLIRLISPFDHYVYNVDIAGTRIFDLFPRPVYSDNRLRHRRSGYETRRANVSAQVEVGSGFRSGMTNTTDRAGGRSKIQPRQEGGAK